jgi:xanthine/CO dehydrogenase XdhC/CoxF family maturation factor
VLSLRVADLVAALGGRPRPLVAGALVSAAASDVGLLEGGVLLTRVSTRSAVSRSVNRVATVARSVSRRASRSLTFVFSALIWSNIVDVVLGMVAFSGFRSIEMINLVRV